MIKNKLLYSLSENYYLINPHFSVVKNLDNKEYIFLDCGNDYMNVYSRYTNDNMTSTEALENHFHLFDNVKKRDQVAVEKISLAIAENLKRSLNTQFPEKKFVVYIDLNFRDSIIIRFHQLWENEELYYEPKYLKDEYITKQLRMI